MLAVSDGWTTLTDEMTDSAVIMWRPGGMELRNEVRRDGYMGGHRLMLLLSALTALAFRIP